MFELIRNKTNFRFMKYRLFWVVFSTILNVAAISYWFMLGDAKYGVDFRGGLEIIARYEKPVEIGEVREALNKAGFKEAIVQSFGGNATDFSVRLRAEPGHDTSKQVKDTLGSFPENKISILKDDAVGPVIGEQIRRDGWIAFWVSLLGILVYIGIRFELSFAIGAIVALFHDAIITGGIYLLSGREVNAALLAAILTIIGYSVNDTVIVYDRIRENSLKSGKGKDGSSKKGVDGKEKFMQVIDDSINQTLSRTILTSLTVFISALTLYLFGGGAVSDLAFAMVVGVIVGTYSTIFIASPIILLAQQMLKRKPA